MVAAPLVFISYSHDSAEHNARVLELAQQLRGAGVDAVLDRFVQHPAEGWPRWVARQVQEAQHVLAICSEAYRRHFDGRDDDRGAVGWDSYLLREEVTRAADGPVKVIPVVLSGGSPRFVPLELRRIAPIYLPEQFPQLLRRLGALGEAQPGAEASPAVVFDQPRAVPGRRIANFPLLGNPDFVGRESELNTVRATLTATQSGGSWEPQIVTGLGGIGKTQLALQYASRRQDEYDVLWLLDASDPALLAREHRRLASELELVDAAVTDEEVRAAAVRRWLGENSRWLLIFDDCPSMEALRPLLPASPRGHVIVTSRSEDWKGVARPIRLGVLAREQAIEVLLRKSGREDARGAEELAARLDNHPLALALAGAQAAEIGFEALRKQLDAAVAAVSTPSSSIDGELAATLVSAILAAQSAVVGADGWFQLAAFLAPSRIPLRLLREHDNVLPADLQAVARDEHALAELFERLEQRGLLTRDGDWLALHPLVQTVVRARANAAAAVAVLDAAVPYDFTEPPTWEAFEELVPHVLAATASTVPTDPYAPRVVILLYRIAGYLGVRGDARAAVVQQQKAVDLAEEVFRDTPEIRSTLVWLLGRLLHGVGDLAASETQLERALGLADQAGSSEEREKISILRDLGMVSRERGDHARAKGFVEQALEIDERTGGAGDRSSIAASLDLLGLLISEQGDNDAAIATLERALAMRLKLSTTDVDLGVAVTLEKLATVRRAAGDLVAARTEQERGLEITRTLLGERHPVVVRELIELSRTLAAQGDFPGARRTVERALELSVEALGEQAAETAMAEYQLGKVLLASGDARGAQRNFDRARGSLVRSAGGENLMLADLLSDQANASLAVGDATQARAAIERSLEIYRKVLGSHRHPHLARILHRFGRVLLVQGDLPAGRQFLEQSLAIAREVGGGRDAVLAGPLVDLGELALREGRLEEAQTLLEQAVAASSAVSGEESMEAGRANFALARTLAEMGDQANADRIAEMVEQTLSAAVGPTSLEVGNLLMWRAGRAVSGDRWGESLELAERALACFEAGGAPSEERAADALLIIGVARAATRDLSGALVALQASLFRHDSERTRDTLLDVVELARESTSDPPIDLAPAIAAIATRAPDWLAARIHDGAEIEAVELDRKVTLGLRVGSAAAAALVAGQEGVFGWRLEMASIQSDGATSEVYPLPVTVRYTGEHTVELTAEVAHLPWGVYLLTIRFLEGSRDVWRGDRTVSNSEPANPFVAGPPVRDPGRFFGRSRLLEDLRKQLDGASISLLGPRRSGKTSVLYRLRDLCKGEWTVALVDLHAFTGDDDRSLLRGISREIAAAAGVVAPVDGERPLDGLLDALRAAKLTRVLLLLDEMAVLSAHPDAAAQLRWMSKWVSPTVRILGAGTSRDLDAVSEATLDRYGSSALNEFMNRELDQLSRQEAVELLERPFLGHYRYEGAAMERLLELGAGRPFFLNLFAHLTLEETRREGGRVVTAAHVDGAWREAVGYLGRWYREFLHELDDASYAALPDLIESGGPIKGAHAEAVRSAGITVGPRRHMRLDPMFIEWWSSGGRR